MVTRRSWLQHVAALTGGLWMANSQQPPEVPWLSEVTQIEASGTRLPPLLIDSSGQAITTSEQWQRHARQRRKAWLQWLGELPKRTEPRVEVLEREVRDGVVRQRVRYRVLDTATTEAYVLGPANFAEPFPAAVVFHSTVEHSIRQPAGVEGAPEKAFGWQLARQGWVCWCPRNYLWPTNDRIEAGDEARRFLEKYPHCRGMARMLHDGQLALDLLSQWPGVDARRLAAVGHSLGAKEVLYLAALDPRVRVAVSSEGGVGRDFSNWEAAWYLGNRLPDRPEPSFRHHELLALTAPRPFLLVGGGSADGPPSSDYVAAAHQAYSLFEKPVKMAYYQHGQGHAVPEVASQRILNWLTTYNR